MTLHFTYMIIGSERDIGSHSIKKSQLFIVLLLYTLVQNVPYLVFDDGVIVSC